MKTFAHPGVAATLTAAFLFGAGTPLAKLLLDQTSPWLLAALLYLGSGTGLFLLRQWRRAPSVRLPPGDFKWLAGATLAGGVAGPVLLMVGLSGMSASGASLLLNAEGVLTALIAWFVFRENFDRRIALGMLAIVAGGVVLAWPSEARLDAGWPALSVVGACLAWGIDNNLTRKVSLADASFVAMVKGAAAGTTNLALALLLGAQWPSVSVTVAAAVLGFASYGVSLALFVIGLRHLGTARTGAYFSIAPFAGAALSVVLLNEKLTTPLVVAGLMMAWGVWLHLTESHQHTHTHEPLEHAHEHDHGAGDEHHQHTHEDGPLPADGKHSHIHQHLPISHRHAHFPDAHHRHPH